MYNNYDRRQKMPVQRQGCDFCKKQEQLYCPNISPLPPDTAVAMAYIPFQTDADIYDNLWTAFCTGTLFPCLNKPFMRAGCKS